MLVRINQQTRPSDIQKDKKTKRQKDKKTKRQKDKKTYRGFDVISHDICNHVILGFWSNTHNLEILWIWCTISQNLSIKQLPIQSTHKSIQSNQSIKTVVQTSASPYSFAVFI